MDFEDVQLGDEMLVDLGPIDLAPAQDTAVAADVVAEVIAIVEEAETIEVEVDVVEVELDEPTEERAS